MHETTKHQQDADRPRVWAAAMWVSLVAAIIFTIVLSSVVIDSTVSPEAGEANARELWAMWLSAAAVFAALSFVAVALVRGWRRAEESKVAFVSSAMFILFIAGVLRVMIVFSHAPTLSDDLWRYIYDGRNLANAVNPYLAVPQHAASDEAADRRAESWPGERSIARRVNNPELTTIYLPTSQVVFLIAAEICEWLPDPSSPEANARIFRSTFAAFDLLLIVLILYAVRAAQRSAWWACLYAWHPLPLIEFAGSGHQDVVGIALVFGAIMLLDRIRQRQSQGAGRSVVRRRVVLTSTAILAFATLVKPFAAPVAAFLLRGQPVRHWLASVATGVVICSALIAPLVLIQGGQPIDNLIATATRFSLKWAHFGSVYEPVLAAIETATNDPDEAWERPDEDLWTNDDQERVARLICGGVLLVISIVLFVRTRDDPWRAVMWFFFAAFLLTPAAHPWYLLWAFALFAVRPSLSLWICSFTALFGYAAWTYTEIDGELHWAAPVWMMLVAYVPVYAAMVFDIGCRRQSG